MIVFPDQYTVERHHLQGKKYGPPDIYNFNEVLSLYTLEIDINLWEMFERQREENV